MAAAAQRNTAIPRIRGDYRKLREVCVCDQEKREEKETSKHEKRVNDGERKDRKKEEPYSSHDTKVPSPLITPPSR